MTNAPRTPLQQLWQRFLRAPGARTGLVLVGFFTFLSLFAPFLAHRFPFVWQSADGTLSYPLLREFFAPSDTTEPLLEKGINFLILFMPAAWLLWKLLGHVFPALGHVESRAVSLFFGVAAAAVLWIALGGMVMNAGGKDWIWHENPPVPEIDDIHNPYAAFLHNPLAAAVQPLLALPADLSPDPEAARRRLIGRLQDAVEGPVLVPIGEARRLALGFNPPNTTDMPADTIPSRDRARYNRLLIEYICPGLLAPMREVRSAFLCMAAACLLTLAGLTAIALVGAAQFTLSPRWLVLAALALVLALPFGGNPRYDMTPYRQLAADGRGWGVFAPIPYGPNEQGFGPRLPPSWMQNPLRIKRASDMPGYHVFGTDESGRDVLVRVIHGARVSLSVGFVSVFLSVVIGLTAGSLAAYYGGRIDMIISRFIEIMMCFPSFFLILAVIAVLDKRSIINIMLVIGLTSWTGIARLIRGEMLRQKSTEYVWAARALGATDARVIFRHIVPNAMAPVLVAVSFGITGAILTEASLSFIGFGVVPPTPTWGQLLSETRESPLANWWLALFPGIILFVSILAYNMVGEALRDALDPHAAV